jgi:uncharacterized protein
MKIAVSQLTDGDNPLHYDEKKDPWIGELRRKLAASQVATVGSFVLDGTLTKLEPDFVFRGNVRFTARLECRRCTESVELPVDHAFALALTPLPSGRSVSQAEAALDAMAAEAADISVFDGHEIDLEELVHEQVCLALPYTVLCAPECRGLCPQCGTNRNVNACGCAEKPLASPFAVLEKWKK